MKTLFMPLEPLTKWALHDSDLDRLSAPAYLLTRIFVIWHKSLQLDNTPSEQQSAKHGVLCTLLQMVCSTDYFSSFEIYISNAHANTALIIQFDQYILIIDSDRSNY